MDVGWALVVPAYLLGTFPTAILVGRRSGRDVTREGSGNPGATNVLRTVGRRAGAVVLAGDLSKGALAAGAGLAIGPRALGVGCGLAAVLGHVAPATRGFRGGKGVATAAGSALVLVPLAAVTLAAVWVGVVAATRTAAIGSIAIAAAIGPTTLALGRPVGEAAAWTACGVLVVARHAGNIRRLRHRTEPSLTRRADRRGG